MLYSVSFNDIRCRDYGVMPITRPNIPAALKKVQLLEIPGRSGVLTIDEGQYEPIEISVEFNFLSTADKWSESFRSIKQWLSGGGDLEFSDDPDFFYKVYNVEITDSERAMKRIGRFTAEFTCDPFLYLKNGRLEYDKSDVLYNPYNGSHPIYRITGEGVCKLSVNGSEMRANVGQNLSINTDLMIAYRTDGALQNTSVSGNYEDLYLQEGANQITITTGFTLKVIPNWRVR